MITPKKIYDVYPDTDLFGFPEPYECETYREYRDRIGPESLSEDRLFHFLLAELCDEDIELDEVEHRIQRAIRDLGQVLDGLIV